MNENEIQKLLENPPAPNQALIDAAERYQMEVDDDEYEHDWSD